MYGISGHPYSCFIKKLGCDLLESTFGHFVPNGGHSVPILSRKSDLDENSFVGSLGQPSQIRGKKWDYGQMASILEGFYVKNWDA